MEEVSISLTRASYIVYLLHDLRAKVSLSEVLLVLHYLESIEESILMESVPASAIETSRHEDTGDGYDVTRSTAASHFVLSSHLHGAGNMANRNLVTLLLDLDFLVRNELAGLNLQNKLTLHVVFSTLNGRAFDLRVEFFSTDDLVNFETTGVTSKDCYFHAGLNI